MRKFSIGVVWGGLSAVSSCAFDSTPLTPLTNGQHLAFDAAALVLRYDASVSAPAITRENSAVIDAGVTAPQTTLPARSIEQSGDEGSACDRLIDDLA